MTAVKDKTRYTPADASVYLTVLRSTEVGNCMRPDLPNDPMAFNLACLEAMQRVPLNDPPKGAFNVDAYVSTRLREALDIRNRWYRDHAKGTVQ